MNDERDALMMAFRNNDVNMAERLLQADLNVNFEHPDGFMYKVAKDYQSKSRSKKNMKKVIIYFPLINNRK